jgi:hypothetical protein
MVVKWIAGEENMEPFSIAVVAFFVLPVVFLGLVALCAMFDGEDE